MTDTLLKRILCFGVCWFWLMFLNAQSINWTGGENCIAIGENLSILEDPEGDLTIDQVSSTAFAKRFKQSETEILNFGFTESLYWLKFSFNNPTDSELLLEIAHAFLPITELYYQDKNSAWQNLKAGYNTPLDEKIVKHHFQVIPLPKGERIYYVKVLSNSHPLPLRIWDKDAYEIKSYQHRLVYGFYLGLMFFVILNNLFLFVSLRNYLYLLYAFVVFIYVCYAAAVMDGFIVYFFPNVDLMFWYINIPTIGVAMQMAYCLLFLEAKKYTPKLNKIGWGVAIYFMSYFFLKFFLPLTIVMAVNTINALISFFMMGFIGVQVGRKGNKMGYYFALAYIIYFGLVLTEATYIQTGFPPYLLGMSHVAYATLIEAFVLSYLLSKRFEWTKRELELERQRANQQVIEKTMENERIVREQNVILEKKVTERTQQLRETNEELSATLETVEEERAKSENLLLNILPAETAQELKEKGVAQPKTYDSVTVLFTDFKDFTATTAHVSPERLVDDLNECFMEFDRIVQKYNLEKIKTIGDAYMAAGGLPTPNDTHALDATLAALEMQSFIEKRLIHVSDSEKNAWQARIGLHSGKVVSGVVGIHKFSYDIWGDTVNTASRMETHGTPGKVNVSEATYQLIKSHFDCAPRGKVEVKGKGDLEMYWVEGIA